MTWFNWFGGNSTHKQPRRFRPALEALERREVPTASLTGRTLEIDSEVSNVVIQPVNGWGDVTISTTSQRTNTAGQPYTYTQTFPIICGPEIVIQYALRTDWRGSTTRSSPRACKFTLDERTAPLIQPVRILGDGQGNTIENLGFRTHTWELPSINAGRLGQHLTFDWVDAVSSAAAERTAFNHGGDRFVMHPSGFMSRVIVGDPDGGTLDYSLLTSGIWVALGNNIATQTNWVEGIRNIIGGRGNDVIGGDYFNNVLVGGGGDDVIEGLRGSDLLVGGIGGDALNGSEDSDIVVGGVTAYDSSPERLAALLVAWADRMSLTLEQRVDALMAGVSTPLGTLRLNASTLWHDASRDTLAQNQGVHRDFLWAEHKYAYGFGQLVKGVEVAADQVIVI